MLRTRPQQMLRTAIRRWQSTTPAPGPAVATASSNAAQQQPASLRLDFDNPREAMKRKSTAELWRALAVFNICSMGFIVKRSRALLNLSNKMLGTAMTNWILRKTFFGHFCAGEDGVTIQPAIRRLQSAGIGAILDYAAEAESINPSDRTGIVSARVFDYDGEAQCERNYEIFKSCIEAAAQGGDRGFAAIKLTALGNVAVLEHISGILHATRRLFRSFDAAAGTAQSKRPAAFYVTHNITLEEFRSGLQRLGVHMSEVDATALFRRIDRNDNGVIDYLEWVESLQPQDAVTRAFFVGGLKGTEGALDKLSEDEVRQMDAMIGRLERLCELAAAKGVRLMIDAEQTYYQPAIDHMCRQMQRKYNIDRAVIFNTFQCYLTDTHSRILLDLERAKRDGFKFAAKLVRGAYIVQERSRAAQRGYKDPIHTSIADTHSNYHVCLDTILKHVPRAEVMVASHNETSVRFAVDRMQQYGIDPRGGSVVFGQLLGMCDHVSFTLGLNGYAVYKYVPYGPVQMVIPYLIRRAEENSNMLGGAGKERTLIWRELRRRMLGWTGMVA